MALPPKIGVASIVQTASTALRPSIGAPVIARPAAPPTWLAVGRSRPRYFDGRFLAASDLARDQSYFAARQLDALRAVGPGVIHGLVPSAASDSALALTAGSAITETGALVIVRQDLELPLFDLAETQRLDQVFGLLQTPRDLPRRRTGVFVLLARPVEYTGDPIGLYPSGLEARREPEDGDVIEAVALSLAPCHDAAADATGPGSGARSALARRIFLDGVALAAPADAVPLGVVQLDRGFVRWVDAWLVRRELGATHTGVAGHVRAPRAVAEAQIQQYRAQLAAIAADRAAHGKPAAYAAREELRALPPAGDFPIATLALASETERFFPPAMSVALQVVPDDEIATVLDEAIALPPIDLAAPDDALAATPVAVLIAAPRAKVESLPPELRSFALRSTAVAPGLRRVRGILDIGLARFAMLPLIDDRGTRLAAALGPVTSAYYARLRRAVGATGDGIVAIERQLIS